MGEKYEKKRTKMITATKENKKRKSRHEIESSRTGGQIALTGYNYQLIYSCYRAVEFLDSQSKSLKLEGVEDIDSYSSELYSSAIVEHIQLKHSIEKQNASFFDSIILNFLEIYLTNKEDNNKYFKLVYDMDIAKGNLSKLISNNLDKSTTQFWIKKINKIKEENPHWNWNGFNFIDFSKQLKFERLTHMELEERFMKLVVDKYALHTGNEKLFIDSLFYNIFQAAKNRQTVTQSILCAVVQNVKDDISKGIQNPAIQWFNKIDFHKYKITKENIEYYEGKKASPADIVNGLPIRRKNLEKEIEDSLKKNKITVIKSSSGQGKTTLAWQVAYNLSEEYTIYQLTWCKDTREINNIIEYIHSRSKLGEKTLIVLDNLDVNLREWNKLAQLLEDRIMINYRLLITSREDDWYTYAGDQSNLVKLKVININLNQEQAKNIYYNLKERNKIHTTILNWQSTWEKVKDKRILIEYVYLLTHGEMLEDRLNQQLKAISLKDDSNCILEILRLTSLADLLSIKLHKDKLVQELLNEQSFTNYDINELFGSLENEYLIRTEEGNYIQGLHRVRSQHISDKLHSFFPVTNSLKKLLKIVDEKYIARVFAKIPFYIKTDHDEFYLALSKQISQKPYSFMVNALEGLFSGSVLSYFKKNKSYFEKANERGGLLLFLVEVGPWNSIDNMGDKVKTLSKLHEIMPENENIKYLINLAREVENFNLESSDIHIFTYYLFNELKDKGLKRDIKSYSTLANWFTRMSKEFDIVTRLNFNEIWNNRHSWPFEELSLLMYNYYILKPKSYIDFFQNNKESVFTYLKLLTDSVHLYESGDNIHIQYLLLPQEVGKLANNKSVSRVKAVGRFLPIYKEYIINGIQPNIDILNELTLVDESYKAMPIENVTSSFNTDLTILWKNSILSNFEHSSVYEWQEQWIEIRLKLITFLKLNIGLVEHILKMSKSFPEVKNLDQTRNLLGKLLRGERLFPQEHRPFDEPTIFIKDIKNVKNGFFTSIMNYLDQYLDIVTRNNKKNTVNIAMYNLRDSRKNLSLMQRSFRRICESTTYDYDLDNIESQENLWLDRLININEFYLNYEPRKGGYSRLVINEWHREKKLAKMRMIKDQLNELTVETGFNLIQPKATYYEDDLIYLPIGVANVDVKNAEVMGLLLFSLSNVLDLDVQYIDLLFLNYEFELIGNGIRISNSYLKRVKENIENGRELADILPPLPIEINQKQLECFEEDIKIPLNKIKSKYENVDILLTLFWKYHQYQSRFDQLETYENIQLTSLKDELILEINSTLEQIKVNCPPDFYANIIKLKDDLTNNKKEFNDVELNKWLEKINYF